MDGGIKLGYEVGTGAEVMVRPSHLIVTGITQLSGKTTTLEALIQRSGLRAIVFKTKIGEKSFGSGTEVPPFFRDRSDYEFVKSLIEAYAKEKLFLEKGTLMTLCKDSGSLMAIKQRVDEYLNTGKARGINLEIYTRLQHYLENLIPQIQRANFSKVLSIYEGINIMNLERFTEEAQALIIQSVADEVLNTKTDTILVIPEAWKFLPQKYNNPCKRTVESFIRQGATNNNFVWIDSQDMAGVDKGPLKQISTWILGYQAERNEVKHTLDEISLPPKLKPKEEEIMTLKRGHFFLSSYDGVRKVYVQPAWMEDGKAILIARGELDVASIVRPESLVPFSIPVSQQNNEPGAIAQFDDVKIRKDLIELRTDFFNKIQELQTAINKAHQELYTLKTAQQPLVDIDEIVSKVQQKMPLQSATPAPVNEEAIIQRVLARIPRSTGTTVYEIAPLEKIKKDFLQKAKDKVVSDIAGLDEQHKQVLKFVETQEKGCTQNLILEKCLYQSGASGGNRNRLSAKIGEMAGLELVRKDKNGSAYPALKDRIKGLIEPFGGTEQETEQVYDHILAGLTKN